MLIDTERAELALRPAKALLVLCTIVILGGFVDEKRVAPRLFVLAPAAAMALTTLIGLTIKEKITKDARGAPEKAVCPALNAAFILVEDKDRARGDHLALRVHEAARYAGDETATGGF